MTWREILLQTAILLVLLVVLFPKTFFAGEVISSGDILFAAPHWDRYAPEGWTYPQNMIMVDHVSFFHKTYSEGRQAVLAGEWPLWNHLEFGGMPLLANFQSSVFYPLRLAQLFMSVAWAATFYVVAKLFLCGIIGYVSARLLGLSVGLSRFYSIAWMLGSYNLVWCHWPLTDVSAWVPLILAGIELILQERYRRGFFTVSLGGTLLLLAGHPETAFTFGLGLGLYFLLRLVVEKRLGRRLWLPVMVCGAAWGLALLVCAAQLVPFGEYVANSSSDIAREAEAGVETYAPSIAAAFWAPRFFGTEAEKTYWGGKFCDGNLISMLYPGMVVWFGVMFLLVRNGGQKWDPRRKNMVVCLLIPSVFGLLLSFYLPALRFVHDLPVLSELREWYHSCFAIFAFPLLAVFGIERWLAGPRKLRELAWALPMVAVGAGLLIALLLFNGGYLRMCKIEDPLGGDLVLWDYVLSEVLIAGALATCTAVVFGTSCFVRKRKLIVILLTVVCAVDSLVVMRGRRTSLPPEQDFPPTALMTFLQEREQPCRVDVTKGFLPAGIIPSYGVESLLGYDGVYPERMRRFQRTLGSDVWKAMEPVYGVNYYLRYPKFAEGGPGGSGDEDLSKKDFLRLVDVIDEMEVYENTRAFSRAFLVGRIKEISDVDRLFEAMLDDAYAPGQVVLTERAPAGPLPEAGGEDLGCAKVVSRESTRVTVSYEAEEDCVLVLADAYYPDWRATVDGKEVEIFPAYYAFRGILAPAGTHTVEFSYFPRSLKVGLLISSISLAFSAFWAVRILRARRGPSDAEASQEA